MFADNLRKNVQDSTQRCISPDGRGQQFRVEFVNNASLRIAARVLQSAYEASMKGLNEISLVYGLNGSWHLSLLNLFGMISESGGCLKVCHPGYRVPDDLKRLISEVLQIDEIWWRLVDIDQLACQLAGKGKPSTYNEVPTGIFEACMDDCFDEIKKHVDTLLKRGGFRSYDSQAVYTKTGKWNGFYREKRADWSIKISW